MSSSKFHIGIYLALILSFAIFDTPSGLPDQDIQRICECSTAENFCIKFVKSQYSLVKASPDYKSFVYFLARAVSNEIVDGVFDYNVTPILDKYRSASNNNTVASGVLLSCFEKLSDTSENLDEAEEYADTGDFSSIVPLMDASIVRAEQCGAAIQGLNVPEKGSALQFNEEVKFGLRMVSCAAKFGEHA